MPEEPDGLSFMLHADPLWPHYSRKGREAHLLAVLLGKRTAASCLNVFETETETGLFAS